jgi:hypothetical protein
LKKPTGHCAQAVFPEEEAFVKEPVGQGAQAASDVPPAAGLNVPAGHGLHAAVPFAKVPAGQVVAVKAHDAAPSALKEPAAHAAQTVAALPPVPLKNRPAVHSEHPALPLEAL